MWEAENRGALSSWLAGARRDGEALGELEEGDMGDDGIGIPPLLVPDVLPKRVGSAAAALELGAILGRGWGTAPRGRRTLWAFEHGLVITPGRFWRVVASYRWTDVRSVVFDLMLDAELQREWGSIVHQFSRLLAFEFADGQQQRLTLWDAPDRTGANIFRMSGIGEDYPRSAFAPFIGAVRDKVAAVQLPEVCRRLAGGAEVGFGAFVASPEGLRHEDTLVRWSERPLVCFEFGYSMLAPMAKPLHQTATTTVRCKLGDAVPLGRPRAEVKAEEVLNLRTLELLCEGMQAEPPLFTVPGTR